MGRSVSVHDVYEYVAGGVQRPEGRLAVQIRVQDRPDNGVFHADVRQANRLSAVQRDLQEHAPLRVVEVNPFSQLGVTFTQGACQALEVKVSTEGCDDVAGGERQGRLLSGLPRTRWVSVSSSWSSSVGRAAFVTRPD